MAIIDRAYPKNMSSLNALELRGEADEGNLTAQLISLALGEDDGVEVTAAQYDDQVGGMKLGHLIFEEYTTEVDAGSREAIHKTKGELLVCKGRAYINNAAKNVMVFREKP
jgi:hypothetical protein